MTERCNSCTGKSDDWLCPTCNPGGVYSLPVDYKGSFLNVSEPEFSVWEVHPFGLLLKEDGSGSPLSIRPYKGGVPNWFHRTAQRLILGHVWVREKK